MPKVKKTTTPLQTILGGVLWFLSFQYFIVEWIVARAWTTPPYSMMYNFISDLGATKCGYFHLGITTYICSPLHTYINISFILNGLLAIIGVFLLRNIFPKIDGLLQEFLLLVSALLDYLGGIFP